MILAALVEAFNQDAAGNCSEEEIKGTQDAVSRCILVVP